MKRSEYNSRDYDLNSIPMDRRFKIAFREMLIVVAVWFIFAGAMLALSYGLGSGDPANYTYVMGLPLWFFASVCAVFAVWVVVYCIVKFVFQNYSLDDEEK